MKNLENNTGFQRDENNAIKIWEKHAVTPMESEQAFFNPYFAFEKRYIEATVC